MKTPALIIFISLLTFNIICWAGIIINNQHQMPDQLTLTVKYIRNDHDVILKDEKNNIYMMTVENAYGEAYVPGTIIYFGKNEVIIK